MPMRTLRAEQAVLVPLVVLLVLLLHAMLAWWWFGARARERIAGPPPLRASVRLIPLPAEPAATLQAPQLESTLVRPRAAAALITAPRREAVATRATPATPSAITPPADAASAPVASAGRPATEASLLDTDATRRAIRASARASGIARLAAEASGTPRPPSEGDRLGASIGTAAHGDCMKGEYAGGGMGVLSLPFLAAAVASGQCAR